MFKTDPNMNWYLNQDNFISWSGEGNLFNGEDIEQTECMDFLT